MINWVCLSCETEPGLKDEELYSHLKKVHGLEGDEIQGTKTPVAFMDGEEFAIQVYEWQINNGVRLRQTVTIDRAAKGSKQ